MSSAFKTLCKILVANRGEIAVRCLSTCRKLGLKTVAIYTAADATSQHVVLADEKALLSSDSTGYTNADEILEICESHAVDAVIPGYGFLSENAGFARRVTAAGMVFVGPSADSIEVMGLKHRARELALHAGVPIVPGTELLSSKDEAIEMSRKLGYPVILKATGGGGGMGLQVCDSPEAVESAFTTVKSRGDALFKNSGVFAEKYYSKSRHIEVQIFGNGVVAVDFGERECSIQRRHQKIIEECPSPFVCEHPELRERLTTCAKSLASSIRYKSAGTIEFLVDDTTGEFFFLEMNTRLQVEHGVTELCYGVDLVELMLLQAEHEKRGDTGIPLEYLQSLQKEEPSGVSIEVRLYAENPAKQYSPCPGILQNVQWAADSSVRVDTWVKTGQKITPYYDPLIAKLMVHDLDRLSSIEKLLQALSESRVQGLTTNQHFLKQIITSKPFRSGQTLTSFLSEEFSYVPCGVEVISAGSYTTIQDFPGRVGKGHGIPKSGPMDDVSSRKLLLLTALVSNLLVGNLSQMEILEMTISGPELLFHTPAVIAVCGATVPVIVDGVEKPLWSRLVVRGGQKVKIGAVQADGCRAYLAVRGGFPEIPSYLGSKSTTPSLNLGGIQGRQLKTGDYLSLSENTISWALTAQEYTLPPGLTPEVQTTAVYVMPGPHDSDDIMLPSDREMIYNSTWKVGHNSSRTGVRLIGPAPVWARKDGGSGGSHPSNIMDYGYPSPGGVNWTGDAPIVFCADSPGLGGFICSSTVVSAGLWRLGQLKPGDSFKLKPITFDDAIRLSNATSKYLEDLHAFLHGEIDENMVSSLQVELPSSDASGAILKKVPGESERPAVCYRQAGDNFVLVEFGSGDADVILTGRIRLITKRLENLGISGIVSHPSMRSINVEYDGNVITQASLVRALHEIESSIEPMPLLKIPSRELRLPIVFNSPILQQAVERYIETQRPTAAYLPDNIYYVQQNNGLDTRRKVFDTMTQSSFLVIAMEFLTGLPVLLPLNPLSRIIAQKYNPSRTYTPGGTIGLGGSLFAIYPIDQPGGYMLLAKTLPVWDTFGTKPNFEPNRPWLCEPFDIISFHEVNTEDFSLLENQFETGNYHFDIRDSVFDLAEQHKAILASDKNEDVLRFRQLQKEGIEKMQELETSMYADWAKAEKAKAAERLDHVSTLKTDKTAVEIVSPINANVWKVLVKEGDRLQRGQVVAILEAMKMEIEVRTADDETGLTVVGVASEPGSIVSPGDLLVLARKG